MSHQSQNAANRWLRWTYLLIILTLSGCGSYAKINQAAVDAQHDYDKAVQQVQAASHNPIIEQSNTPYLSLQPVAAPKELKVRIPRSQDCSIKFIADAPMSLSDFSQIVSQECGVQIRVTQDAWAALANGSIQDVSSDAVSDSATGAAPIVPGIGGPSGAQPGVNRYAGRGVARDFAYTTAGNAKIQPIRWLGKPLSGLLDVITSQLGLYWAYQDGYVTISYLQTRSFHLALSSELDFQSRVSSGASLSGSGSSNSTSGSASSKTTGDSDQKTVMAFKSHFGLEVRQGIQAMLTPGVGKFAMSPSIGTVTVTDTPEVLDRIGQYISSVNDRMSRQVMLYVTVAQITLSDSDSLGINWSAVWNSLTGNYGITLASGFSPLSGASSAGFGILSSAKGTAGQFAGTKAILSALAKQGSVSILRQRGVTTQNLQPTPIHLTNEQQYVCGVSQTSTAQVGSTNSIQMCSVVTGFAMDIVPDIYRRDVTLLFSLNMSPPATITQVPTGANSSAQPVFAASVDRQVFLQRVGMQSGQTLVISDFQQASETTARQGVGSVSAWIPTGGGTRDKSRNVVVIIISPQIMKSLDTEDTSQAANEAIFDRYRLKLAA